MKGHAWVKARYIDGTDYGKTTYTTKEGSTVAFIPANVYDNTALMQNDPAYIKRLENLPENEKQAFLYGNWDIFEGQYFNEFDRDIHVIEPFKLEPHWRRYVTIDYGLDMLAVLFIAVDEQKRAYCYKEIYESGLIISDAAQRIKEHIEEGENISLFLAPPDLWNARQETGKSMAIIFSENDIPLTKSNNSRIDGWLSVKEYLKVYTGEDEKATANIKIFSTCRNLIRTLPLLRYDDKKINDVATEPHELTHINDALRYFTIYWTAPAEVEESISRDHWTKDHWEDYYRGNEEERRMMDELWGRKTN